MTSEIFDEDCGAETCVDASDVWRTVEEEEPPQGVLLAGQDDAGVKYGFYYRQLDDSCALFLDAHLNPCAPPRKWSYLPGEMEI